MTPYLDPQSMRDVKYGFYHPEDTGYMHVRHLGHGIQGTVTLVRCAITGELLVRKRRHFEHNNGTVDNELTFSRAISHPNVTNPVVEQKYFDNSNPPKVSVVSYWQYYNCGDLTTLINKHRRLGHRVPEVVIWRYLSQILGAIYQTHLQGVAHMDGHKANILVHWGEGDILPTFALGDWGKAVVLPSEAHDPLVHPGLGWEAGTESIDDTQTIPPDESLPELSLDALYNHQPHTPALPRTELCLASIANDFEFLNENLEPLMSASTDLLHPPREDEEDDEDMPFESDSDSGGSDHSSNSAELHYVHVLLNQLESYLLGPSILTFKRYQRLFGLLYEYILSQEAQWRESPLTEDVLRILLAVHPSSDSTREEKNEMMLFNTIDELERSEARPPGPWCLAMVEARTGEILGVDEQVRDEARTVCGVAGR